MNEKVLEFIKSHQNELNKPIHLIDWKEMYTAAKKELYMMETGEFTEFLLNLDIHPERYLEELPHSFLCESDVKEFTIPNKVTDIGDYAFYNCTNLTKVTIPDNVTTIRHGAFMRCNSLTSVVIPNSVTSIGGSAFDYCISLTNITIPNSVTSIRCDAFSNCGDKLVISYRGTKEQWKKVYDTESFRRTYFTVNCTDGKIVKRKK